MRHPQSGTNEEPTCGVCHTELNETNKRLCKTCSDFNDNLPSRKNKRPCCVCIGCWGKRCLCSKASVVVENSMSSIDAVHKPPQDPTEVPASHVTGKKMREKVSSKNDDPPPTVESAGDVDEEHHDVTNSTTSSSPIGAGGHKLPQDPTQATPSNGTGEDTRAKSLPKNDDPPPIVESAGDVDEEYNDGDDIPLIHHDCPCCVQGCEKSWYGPCNDCDNDENGELLCYCEEHFEHDSHSTLAKKGAATLDDEAGDNGDLDDMMCECLEGCGRKYEKDVVTSFKKCATSFCLQKLSALCSESICTTCRSFETNSEESTAAATVTPVVSNKLGSKEVSYQGVFDSVQRTPEEMAIAKRPKEVEWDGKIDSTVVNVVVISKTERKFKTRVIPTVVNEHHLHQVQFALEVASKYPCFPLYNWWVPAATHPSRLDPAQKKLTPRPWIARCAISHPNFKDGSLILVQPLESTCNDPIMGAVVCNLTDLKEIGRDAIPFAFRIFKESTSTDGVDMHFMREMRMDPSVEFDVEFVMECYLEWLVQTRRIYDPSRGLTINATPEYWSQDNATLKAEREKHEGEGFFFQENEGDEIFHTWYNNGEPGRTKYVIPRNELGLRDFRLAYIETNMLTVENSEGLSDPKIRSLLRKETLLGRRKVEEESKAKADAEAQARKVARHSTPKKTPTAEKSTAGSASSNKKVDDKKRVPAQTVGFAKSGRSSGRPKAQPQEVMRGTTTHDNFAQDVDNHMSFDVPAPAPVTQPNLKDTRPAKHDALIDSSINKVATTNDASCQHIALTPSHPTQSVPTLATPSMQQAKNSDSAHHSALTNILQGASLQDVFDNWWHDNAVGPEDYMNSELNQVIFKAFTPRQKEMIVQKWSCCSAYSIRRKHDNNSLNELVIRKSSDIIAARQSTPSAVSLPLDGNYWNQITPMQYWGNKDNQQEKLALAGANVFTQVYGRFKQDSRYEVRVDPTRNCYMLIDEIATASRPTWHWVNKGFSCSTARRDEMYRPRSNVDAHHRDRGNASYYPPNNNSYDRSPHDMNRQSDRMGSSNRPYYYDNNAARYTTPTRDEAVNRPGNARRYGHNDGHVDRQQERRDYYRR